MFQIIPALLVPDKKTFVERLRQIEPHFSMAQIDVMDGVFVPNASFANPVDIELIETPMHFELHLMVAHPLRAIPDWRDLSNVERVIFHIECEDDPEEVIEEILFHGWEAGVALNPETPTSAVEHILDRVSTVLFLGVHPGRSGAPFIPETIAKISTFSTRIKQLSNTAIPTLRSGLRPLRWTSEGVGAKHSRERAQSLDHSPRIAVDGGVTHDTLPALKAAGAEVFCMSSELFEMHTTVEEALKELHQLLK